MKYRIVEWKFLDMKDNENLKQQNIDSFIESEYERCKGYNSYISLVSENQYTHMSSDYEFDNYIDGCVKFEQLIKRYNLPSWKEVCEQRFQSEINLALKEIESFRTSYSNMLIIKKDQPIIYFLFKEKQIVYVGQTHSLKTGRPWQHSDKDWDSVCFYPVKDYTQLNNIETYLIYKLKPKYNDHPGPMKQQMLKTIVYALSNGNSK